MGIVYTNSMIDGDEVNIRIREEKAYYAWLKKRSVEVRKITNPSRRQEEWNKLFPKWVPDDSYLEGGIY